MATIYTDQEILDEAREALFGLVSRKVKSATVGADTYTLVDIDRLQAVVDYYQSRVESGSGYASLVAAPQRLRNGISGARRRYPW